VESIHWNTIKAVLFGLIAISFVLNRLSRRFPDIAWLQLFRLPLIQLSEERRIKRERLGNRMAAFEMILAGLAIPAAYLLSTVMFMSEPKMLPMLIVGACSIACIGAGIWIFAKNF
jgi:hypothetical protein